MDGVCTKWSSRPFKGRRHCGDGDPAKNPMAANYTEGGTDCKACGSSKNATNDPRPNSTDEDDDDYDDDEEEANVGTGIGC